MYIFIFHFIFLSLGIRIMCIIFISGMRLSGYITCMPYMRKTRRKETKKFVNQGAVNASLA